MTLHAKRDKGPWELVQYEEFLTRSEALRRERELKTDKGRDWIKHELVKGCDFAAANCRSPSAVLRASEPRRESHFFL